MRQQGPSEGTRGGASDTIRILETVPIISKDGTVNSLTSTS
jgi:hypothetical protein